ncbi:hypothetical protein Tco_0177155 [Tanacetum coccineum]
MFDLDLLTPSMNYIPVRKENYADSKEQGISCDDVEDLDDQQFIVHTAQPMHPEERTAAKEVSLSSEEQALHDELVSLMHQESLAKPPRALSEGCGRGSFFDNHVKTSKMVFKFLQTCIYHADFRKFFRNLNFGGSARRTQESLSRLGSLKESNSLKLFVQGNPEEDLKDYAIIDNESTICIVKNPVFHSKTKHIQIRHH